MSLVGNSFQEAIAYLENKSHVIGFRDPDAQLNTFTSFFRL